MSRALALVLGGGLHAAACGGGAHSVSKTHATPSTQRHNDAVLIRDRLIVAATAGAEPISTGKVLQGSTLGGAPFCAGGTLRDTHASADPAMKQYLIDRTITCPDGTVRVGLTPQVPLRA